MSDIIMLYAIIIQVRRNSYTVLIPKKEERERKKLKIEQMRT